MEIQNQDSHFSTAQNRLRRKEKNCRLHKPLDASQRMAARKQNLPSSPAEKVPVPTELIDRRIYIVRGRKVMLDADLAQYQVETRALNQAVRRNPDRFPEDFMFQLTAQEASALRSQIVTLEKGRGRHSKYAPLAFTELGVAMLSSVLNSDRAVQMNILIMRAFVRLREALATNEALASN